MGIITNEKCPSASNETDMSAYFSPSLKHSYTLMTRHFYSGYIFSVNQNPIIACLHDLTGFPRGRSKMT